MPFHDYLQAIIITITKVFIVMIPSICYYTPARTMIVRAMLLHPCACNDSKYNVYVITPLHALGPATHGLSACKLDIAQAVVCNNNFISC